MGDRVRRALSPPSFTNPQADREFGSMPGVIVKVLVGKRSGRTGKKATRGNQCLVQWESGVCRYPR